MHILVIEDNEYKFNKIKESLNRILKNPDIVWMDSMSAGLVSFRERNVKTNTKPYHLVITDNYLPIYSVDDNDIFERDVEIVPCASSIVSEIRRQGFSNLPIIVCSSEEVEECDYNYFMKYDSSVLLDETFKTIFSDLAAYQIIRESKTVSSKYSKLTEACEQYPELQLVPNNRAYQVSDETIHADRFIESFMGKSQEQGPVKKLVSNKK